MHHSVVPTVLVDLAIIILLTRAAGAAFSKLGQPAVVGEIVAGIALGPSLLGGLHVGDKTLASRMFPPDVLAQLTGLANLGLVIFMMIVGLELNVQRARSLGRRAASISIASVALPLGLGALLGGWLYTSMGGGGPRLAFVLLIGVSMSVTAFPVLARILVERRLHRTPLGGLVLACAGIDDVLAWSLLALATAFASGAGLGELARVLGLLSAFCLVLVLLVRPALGRLVARYERVGRLTPPMVAAILVGLSLSAAATELIGVHFVFGAFLFGATMPRAGSAAFIGDLLGRLEQVAVLVLLPVFFVVSGLAVDLRTFGPRQVGVLAAVVLLACVGKFVGAAGAARLLKVPTRQAIAVGILMNTRGLTELVVLNVGYQAGLLSRELLTIFVVMALVTTVITKPLLRLAYPDSLVESEIADAERLVRSGPDAFGCLVVVENLPAARRLARLGCELTPPGRTSEVVIAWFAPLTHETLHLASGLAHELDQAAERLQAANALAAELSTSGVTCSVVHRLSEDPFADVLVQVRELQPDCVIASESLPDPQRLRADLPPDAQLLLVSDEDGASLSDPVLVGLSGGPDAIDALSTGLQLASSRRTVLRLVDVPCRARWARAATLAPRLRRAGVDVDVVPPGSDHPCWLVGERDSTAGAGSVVLLRVHAARDSGADRSLDDVLAALPQAVGTTTSRSRT